MRDCSVLIRFDAGALAPALHGALLPESAEPLLRGGASVALKGDQVEVLVEADDVVALRAGVNAYLRSAAVALDAAGAAR